MRIRRKPWARPELAECPFCIDDPENHIGHWHELFPKQQPLHLELGCGKGGFMAQKAVSNPDINFIAVDIKSDILGLTKRNIEKSYEEAGKETDNVRIFAYDIERILQVFDSNDVVDRIYINFCDPWPRKKNAKRRLTYHTFLEKYKKVLKLGGQIHFKTDNAKLFEWSLPEMESCYLELHNLTRDLHANGPVGIMTGYEEKFYALGTPINRVEAVVVTKQPRPADEKGEGEENNTPTDDGKEQES